MKKMFIYFIIFCPLFVFASNESALAWEAHLNDFFGQYIVSPLAALLFWPIPVIHMPLVVAWLLGGALFFTIKMRFVNIRMFKHAFRLVFSKQEKNESKSGEVSHFQALTTALSATVGLGNIAGVAIAIGMGCPQNSPNVL
jgi:AGCS family alanine or glycine:cation symporter